MTEPSWRHLARRAASRNVAPDATEAFVQELLVVQLAESGYALPVERVREIVRLRPITRVPGVPASVCGVISLRGEVFQVVDLCVRLGLSAADAALRRRIVVLHGDDGCTAGLLVDGVREVLRAPEGALRPAPPDASSAVSALCPRGSEFLSVLDLDAVLDLDGSRAD